MKWFLRALCLLVISPALLAGVLMVALLMVPVTLLIFGISVVEFAFTGSWNFKELWDSF